MNIVEKRLKLFQLESHLTSLRSWKKDAELAYDRCEQEIVHAASELLRVSSSIKRAEAQLEALKRESTNGEDSRPGGTP